ncbi:MAG: hypothetical protein NTU54_08110 [Candidatus Omnitrophica bacterium]|nr:hypothetical protein [Candidatus Omnitrophota bacterium]
MSKSKSIIFILTVYFLSAAGYAGATELFEPYLKVYGSIRPAVSSKTGQSLSRAKLAMNRIFLNIDRDFCQEKFGFHTLTEYQEGKNGHYPDEWWLDEGYFYYKPAFGTLKAGKVYNPFGLLWDHTFYGSMPFYKGYMSDADYGLTFQRQETLKENLKLEWTGGYFIRDDGLNGETVRGVGFEFKTKGERSTFELRLNPRLKINEKSSFELGLSGLFGKVKGETSDRQAAGEVDAIYKYGPLALTGECVFYDKAYPRKDKTLRGDTFFVEGNFKAYNNPGSKILKGIVLNYNYSRDEPAAGATTGQMQQPSVTFQFTRFFKTEVTFVDWTNDTSTVDRSWFMVFTLDY